MTRNALLRALAAVLVAAGLTAPATAGEAVSWGPCLKGTLSTEAAQLPLAAGLQCATLSVPLDYRQPGGRRIDVVISRVRSAKPAARRGVLLLNPGGPGGSGL
ncbi:MAG TPA: alpha/beta hydrolase, partial [Amycolatopsis sp.]|nr:alpha/beta hydrolase [Amycolatopsis sp.]